MNILFYFWGENAYSDMEEAFVLSGHTVTKCDLKCTNYTEDETFEKRFGELIEKQKFDFVFSFDFFPIIAKVANEKSVPYLSWIYDMPHNTVFSKAACSSNNYIFTFDKTQLEEIKAVNEAANVYYLPLAVNIRRVSQVISDKDTDYINDISFVGSLYEECNYNKIGYLPEYLKGYFDGLFTLSRGNYLFNLAEETFTDEVYENFSKWVKLELGDSYLVDKRKLYIDLINKKQTSIDRIWLLNNSSKFFDTAVYTGGKSDSLENLRVNGYVDYHNKMPVIFRKSKINLNISLRSIATGIPLRCIDIIGARGFLMSNYQRELAEEFTDGTDMVMFYNTEDMLDKMEYYINHDSERMKIVENGYKKVCESYTFERRVKEMLDYAFGANYEKR